MMKKRVTFMVICLLLATVAAGHAQVKANSFSVTPFVGGYTFEGNSNFKTAPVFGLRGAYHFTKHLGLEGFFNYVPTENTALTSNADVKLYGGGIEGLYHFMPDSRFVPFVAVGVGGTRYSPAGGVKERDRFTVDYGAGVKYFLTENLALRADVRHIILPLNDRFNELLYTVGINFAFGGAKKAEPSVMTTRAAEPAAAAAPAVVVVKDSDGDGVYDYLDKCPGTPAGVEVDQDGCPLPVVQTMAPQAASAVEAAIVEKGRVTLKVKFDFDKAVVKKNYHEEIARLAAVLKKYPDLRIAIEGHTDNVGGAAYNEKLSQRRADAVKNVLTTKFGVKEFRMETKGYGQTRPIGSNATKEGRRMNRRVEAAADYIIRK
jgi:OOP family OmpA-OmpF porin